MELWDVDLDILELFKISLPSLNPTNSFNSQSLFLPPRYKWRLEHLLFQENSGKKELLAHLSLHPILQSLPVLEQFLRTYHRAHLGKPYWRSIILYRWGATEILRSAEVLQRWTSGTFGSGGQHVVYSAPLCHENDGGMIIYRQLIQDSSVLDNYNELDMST